MTEIKLYDIVEHLKTHMVGRVVGVAKDTVKVIFVGNRTKATEPNNQITQNCKPEELRVIQ